MAGESMMIKVHSLNSEQRLFPAAQKGATTETEWNANPTKVPPPIAALTGTLGQRHLICVIGLPFSGQIPVTHLLRHYLEFMHGAEVRLFDVNDHTSGTPEENRASLLEVITTFLTGKRSADSAEAANIRPLVGKMRAGADLVSNERFDHVDSGRVAIVFDSNVGAHGDEWWSAATKRSRRWIADQIREQNKSVSSTFVEVIVTDPEMIRSNLRRYDPRRTSLPANNELAALIETRREYHRGYTTIQSHDNSEDELSYVKITNFETTLAHRMRGFLRQRVLQILSAANPKPRTIYLSRHGFSEYNVLGKLGGNPPLSQWGETYAHRLGEWVAENIQRDPDGNPVRARLWTSSMQVSSAPSPAHSALASAPTPTPTPTPTLTPSEQSSRRPTSHTRH